MLAIPPSAPAFAWGAYPNPQFQDVALGLSKHLRARINRAGIKHEVAPYRTCSCAIWDRMRAMIFDSHRVVVPFFELESRVHSFSAETDWSTRGGREVSPM